MKINVGLIGKGNWGLRIKKKLNKIANLQFTCGKKKNYLSEIKLKNIKWIFIATPNHTHYQIVKQCLQNGVNVFCEKPLCLSYNKAQRLINFARSKKLKLYVSDLYDFYSNKINKLNNLNYIYRSKYVSGKDNEFFYRFMYHDISILYNFLKKNSLTNCVIRSYKKKKFFEITIKLKKKNLLNFSYNLNLKNKKHIINKININSKRDILNQMLFDVLNNNVNFKKNNIKALFILKTLHRIKKKAKQIDQKN